MKEVEVVYRTDFGHTGFWIRDALGIIVFFKTHNRKLAQDKCDELFGKSKYAVNNRGSK